MGQTCCRWHVEALAPHSACPSQPGIPSPRHSLLPGWAEQGNLCLHPVSTENPVRFGHLRTSCFFGIFTYISVSKRRLRPGTIYNSMMSTTRPHNAMFSHINAKLCLWNHQLSNVLHHTPSLLSPISQGHGLVFILLNSSPQASHFLTEHINFELFFKNLVFFFVAALWAVHYSCPEVILWLHTTCFPILPAHT